MLHENVTINKILDSGTKKLISVGISGARRDARILLAKALDKNSEYLMSNPNIIVEKKLESLFLNYISRRCNREPVSKIVGEKLFWKNSFLVNSDVLDPRPDSELIIESVIKYNKFKDKEVKILDIGTGSGALLLSLLSEFPGSQGFGIDKSLNAIKLAKKNSLRQGLSKSSNFAVMDWCEGLKAEFDIIISNPPYIPSAEIETLCPEVRLFDPELALNGGPDGLKKIEIVLNFIPNILKKSGFAVLEIGHNQLSSVEKKIMSNRLKINEIFRDLSGFDRCIVVSLLGK